MNDRILTSFRPDFWEAAAADPRPKVLYGTGDGADKFIAYAAQKGIEISGVFASDGFVRSRKFHDFPVCSYSDMRARYGDGGFVVLVVFASRFPDVVAKIAEIASQQTLYIPDLPVAGQTLFDREFVEEHCAELSAARELFADERSREVFDLCLSSKYSGGTDDLLRSAEDESYTCLFDLTEYSSYLDLGAYDGDTVRRFAAASKAEALDIAAVEPDPATFARMRKRCAAMLEDGRVRCRFINAAAHSESGKTLIFSSKGSRGSVTSADGGDKSASGGKTTEVTTVTADDICFGDDSFSPQYVKYDVEGSEYDALVGSARMISELRPDLCVSAYHRAEDLCTLPAIIKRLCPDYRLYLRRKFCLPAWEIEIFATVGK